MEEVRLGATCRESTLYNVWHINNGGRSSVGRAPDCDSGGRGFEPHRPPQILKRERAWRITALQLAEGAINYDAVYARAISSIGRAVDS